MKTKWNRDESDGISFIKLLLERSMLCFIYGMIWRCVSVCCLSVAPPAANGAAITQRA